MGQSFGNVPFFNKKTYGFPNTFPFATQEWNGSEDTLSNGME
jgi:hypothetical protein